MLKYFLSNNQPVIDKTMLANCHLMSNREWLNFVEPLQGSIVTYPGKVKKKSKFQNKNNNLFIFFITKKKETIINKTRPIGSRPHKSNQLIV